MSKLVQGVGINDADYPIANCSYYRKWNSMLYRCYSKTSHRVNPSYRKCTVTKSWLTFSNFKAWMKKQNWEGKQLDKDLLVEGNKIYSPRKCAFISKELNIFIGGGHINQEGFLKGVSYDPHRGKFTASVRNPFTKSHDNLGSFNTEKDAHQAWKNAKHIIALEFCKTLEDERLIRALKIRFVSDHKGKTKGRIIEPTENQLNKQQVYSALEKAKEIFNKLR